MSALGQKRTFRNVRAMSALPPKADIALHRSECPLCATFGREQPQQNRSLFDHLVGAGEQRRRHIDTHRLPGFDVDDQLKLCRLLYWQLGRLSAF